MFSATGEQNRRFDDFRENGLLLPCREPVALRMGMPLHRGPHRHYSALVIERVGQIELGWSRRRLCDDESAAAHVRWRLGLLQGALRRSLLEDRRRRIVLNRKDPLQAVPDFSDLDAVAEALWGATEPERKPESVA
jgi:hypothetical protein